MQELAKDCKFVRHSNAVAAGTSAITPTNGVDTAGFSAATFLVAFGALTAGAVTSFKIQQSDDDGSADDYDDLEGTGQTVADDDDNKVFVVTIRRPQKRYLKCIVSRGTANAVLDGIIAILHDGTSMPVTQDATVGGAEVHMGPAEGTA